MFLVGLVGLVSSEVHILFGPVMESHFAAECGSKFFSPSKSENQFTAPKILREIPSVYLTSAGSFPQYVSLF